MNKTFCKKNHIFSLILAGCLILFNLLLTSCGLDTFYVVEAPTSGHVPIYSDLNKSEHYFTFTTNEISYEGITFIGTEVYYKIYNNSSRLSTETSNISTSDLSTNQSADRMRETYRFQTLRCSSNRCQKVV